jgi:hypothetical protein
MEVDWHAFFTSFFTMIRIKINCKDPTKIPMKRVLEMNNQLFLINFKVEDFEQEQVDPEEKDNGDEDGGDSEEENMEGDDLLGEELEKGVKKDGNSTEKRDDGNDSSKDK